MERFLTKEKEDLRLTPEELDAVLRRWRDDRENTVSIADVAEALHCSKAEIEALVWRARAEGKVGTSRTKPSGVVFSFRSLMILFLGISVLLCLIASGSGNSDFRSTMFGTAGFIFVGWTIYASLTVLIDAVNKRAD